MTDLAGLVVYAAAVWAALTLFDELQQRRRVANWRDRAARIRALKGTP